MKTFLALLALFCANAAEARAAHPLSAGLSALASARPAAAARAFEAARSDTTGWAAYFHARALVLAADTPNALARLEDPVLRKQTPAAFAAALFHGALRRSESPYEAASRLLGFANDFTYGAEALYESGRILAAAGDLANAAKMWSDAVLLHPGSPWAHDAVVELTSMPHEIFSNLSRADDFLTLAAARTAFHTGDFATALYILHLADARPVDRRIREEMLLLTGQSYFRLSEYDSAARVFRHAGQYVSTPMGRSELDKWRILTDLHSGDTAAALQSLDRIASETQDKDFQERLANVAAVLKRSLDPRAAELLRARLGVATLDEFLDHRDLLAGIPPNTPARAAAFRTAYAAAIRLTDRLDRSIALILLAETEPDGDPKIWREIIHDADLPFIVDHAARMIASSTGADRPVWEREATIALRAAQDAAKAGHLDRAIRGFRMVHFGYPGTQASKAAETAAKKLVGEILAPRDESELIRLFMEAGMVEAAEILGRARRDPRIDAAKAAGYSMLGRTPESLKNLDALFDREPGVFPAELPAALKSITYPLPKTGAAARTRAIKDPAVAVAIARVESRFDPMFHEGFLIGWGALPIEIAQMAPQLETLSDTEAARAMLDQDTSALVLDWYLKTLSDITGETEPYRLAAAKQIGPANLPEMPGEASLFRWIAGVPFRQTRRFLIRFLDAYASYHKTFASIGSSLEH